MSKYKVQQSYSQSGQDRFYIEHVIKTHDPIGYFVDLAAGDGVIFSNTILLEKFFNWNGLCIEANCETYEKLKRNRTCLCDNSVILRDNEQVTFINNATVDIFNHLESHIQGLWNESTNVRSKELRTCYSLSTILDKYNVPNIIDYFSFDVEGSELPILQDFFQKNKRKILFWSIEKNPDSDKIKQIMQDNNYIYLTEAEKYTIDHQFILK